MPTAIPPGLLPRDGRFGSGPSKIRRDQLDDLTSSPLLGTSHRQAPVRSLVAQIRTGLIELFEAPDGWEVMLGNGGATAFWDAAIFGLIDRHSAHLVFGEFSSKFAEASAAAPHLADPDLVSCEPGNVPGVQPTSADAICLTHNETSTGAALDLSTARMAGDGLVLVDATSAAGAMPVPLDQVDVYYFSPQKALGADGGLWLALCSPRATARIESLRRARWSPGFLDLGAALDNSRLDQTLNTPSIATLVLVGSQLRWILDRGGLAWTSARSAESSSLVYAWAERSDWATPFVREPRHRSPVVATIDLEGVDATAVCAALRANGIVDTEPYRKLGRNQIRIGTFPSVDPEDVGRLLTCIDWIVERLR